MSDFQFERGFPFPFGATFTAEGVNFAIAAKEAEKAALCLYEESQRRLLKEIELDPLQHKTGDVWHILIKGLPEIFAYGYKVKPFLSNDTYLLLDPYAKLLDTSCKWGEPAEMPYSPIGRAAASQPFDWQGDKCLRLPNKEMVLYEMHLRGFTQDSSSQVEHPGTFLGLIEKIPYLKDLGINAIELMPLFEFNEREISTKNPKTGERLYNYFGYSTVNFFSPMNRYASKSDHQNTLTEFKMLVRELHKNGIELILDVVYNHTFEGNEKGPVQSFRGLNKRAYYMMDADGNYLNFSGCGNTFNSNHPLVRELILDSLRYWVTEMHVDGFRFDLGSILTRAENGTPLANAPIVEAISLDPILSETKLISEAWDAGGLYQVGHFYPGTRWSEWNGQYRDIVRRFIKGTSGMKAPFATAICGSQDLYGAGRSPTCSINFVTAHDGFSLADLVSYNGKHNEENGENNRDGFDHNESWNCGVEGHSSNKRIVYLRERQIRNFHLALMVSQGIPMLLMGDEYAHTRHGNNNTWCQDNELNWFLWNRLDIRPGFYRFYRALIHFRKNQPLLNREAFLGEKDITWHGLNPVNPDWGNDNRFSAFTLNREGKPELYVAFNASHAAQLLATPPLEHGKQWKWVVNTHNPSPEDYYDEGNRPLMQTGSYRIPSYSAIMLQA